MLHCIDIFIFTLISCFFILKYYWEGTNKKHFMESVSAHGWSQKLSVFENMAEYMAMYPYNVYNVYNMYILESQTELLSFCSISNKESLAIFAFISFKAPYFLTRQRMSPSLDRYILFFNLPHIDKIISYFTWPYFHQYIRPYIRKKHVGYLSF